MNVRSSQVQPKSFAPECGCQGLPDHWISPAQSPTQCNRGGSHAQETVNPGFHQSNPPKLQPMPW